MYEHWPGFQSIRQKLIKRHNLRYLLIIIIKMFTKIHLNYETNLFDQLSAIQFENIIPGRQGAILANLQDDKIPIVRSTTSYNNPTQSFLPIHHTIIEDIKSNSQIKDLNNAQIEIYDSQYRKMKFHTDQSLDLADNSYICIYSCYDKPKYDVRKLIIKEKQTSKQTEMTLDHNSVIIFSTETNKKHLHKIILQNNNYNNLWLGITFRLSKTWIKFINEIPYFESNKQLILANKDEQKELRKLKGLENSKLDYQYPEISYTISTGDLIPMVSHNPLHSN
jgi:hypothetical protein